MLQRRGVGGDLEGGAGRVLAGQRDVAGRAGAVGDGQHLAGGRLHRHDRRPAARRAARVASAAVWAAVSRVSRTGLPGTGAVTVPSLAPSVPCVAGGVHRDAGRAAQLGVQGLLQAAQARPCRRPAPARARPGRSRRWPGPTLPSSGLAKLGVGGSSRLPVWNWVPGSVVDLRLDLLVGRLAQRDHRDELVLAGCLDRAGDLGGGGLQRRHAASRAARVGRSRTAAGLMPTVTTGVAVNSGLPASSVSAARGGWLRLIARCAPSTSCGWMSLASHRTRQPAGSLHQRQRAGVAPRAGHPGQLPAGVVVGGGRVRLPVGEAGDPQAALGSLTQPGQAGADRGHRGGRVGGALPGGGAVGGAERVEVGLGGQLLGRHLLRMAAAGQGGERGQGGQHQGHRPAAVRRDAGHGQIQPKPAGCPPVSRGRGRERQAAAATVAG